MCYISLIYNMEERNGKKMVCELIAHLHIPFFPSPLPLKLWKNYYLKYQHVFTDKLKQSLYSVFTSSK